MPILFPDEKVQNYDKKIITIHNYDKSYYQTLTPGTPRCIKIYNCNWKPAKGL